MPEGAAKALRLSQHKQVLSVRESPSTSKQASKNNNEWTVVLRLRKMHACTSRRHPPAAHQTPAQDCTCRRTQCVVDVVTGFSRLTHQNQIPTTEGVHTYLSKEGGPLSFSFFTRL